MFVGTGETISHARKMHDSRCHTDEVLPVASGGILHL